MAFKFRLEALLTMRLRQQELAEAELSRIEGRLNDCREAMKILAKKLDRARENLASGIEIGILAREYIGESQHMAALHARLEEFRLEETRLMMDANRARHNLKIRYRERELVEKLRDRDYELYVQEMQRLEQKEADNLSTIRYIRQHSQKSEVA